MHFVEFGTDFYWLERNGRYVYLIDLDYDGTGVSFCCCPDFLYRRQRYAEQGLIDDCRHIRALKQLLKE